MRLIQIMKTIVAKLQQPIAVVPGMKLDLILTKVNQKMPVQTTIKIKEEPEIRVQVKIFVQLFCFAYTLPKISLSLQAQIMLIVHILNKVHPGHPVVHLEVQAVHPSVQVHPQVVHPHQAIQLLQLGADGSGLMPLESGSGQKLLVRLQR